jgi:hypothetical protein
MSSEGETMTDIESGQKIQVFGTEVTVDRLKVNITAIGEGFTVVAQVILDDEDVLVAATVSSNSCDWEYAADNMAAEALSQLNDWLKANQ